MKWEKYVDKMIDSGKFEKELFGSWIKEKQSDQKDKTPEEELLALMSTKEDLRKLINAFKKSKDQKGPKGPGKPKGRPRTTKKKE